MTQPLSSHSDDNAYSFLSRESAAISQRLEWIQKHEGEKFYILRPKLSSVETRLVYSIADGQQISKCLVAYKLVEFDSQEAASQAMIQWNRSVGTAYQVGRITQAQFSMLRQEFRAHDYVKQRLIEKKAAIDQVLRNLEKLHPIKPQPGSVPERVDHAVQRELEKSHIREQEERKIEIAASGPEEEQSQIGSKESEPTPEVAELLEEPAEKNNDLLSGANGAHIDDRSKKGSSYKVNASPVNVSLGQEGLVEKAAPSAKISFFSRLGAIFRAYQCRSLETVISKKALQVKKDLQNLYALQERIQKKEKDKSEEVDDDRIDNCDRELRSLRAQEGQILFKIDRSIVQLQKKINERVSDYSTPMAMTPEIIALFCELESGLKAIHKVFQFKSHSDLRYTEQELSKLQYRMHNVSELREEIWNKILLRDQANIPKLYKNIEFRHAVLLKNLNNRQQAKQALLVYTEKYKNSSVENLQDLVKELNRVLKNPQEWGCEFDEIIPWLHDRIMIMKDDLEKQAVFVPELSIPDLSDQVNNRLVQRLGRALNHQMLARAQNVKEQVDGRFIEILGELRQFRASLQDAPEAEVREKLGKKFKELRDAIKIPPVISTSEIDLSPDILRKLGLSELRDVDRYYLRKQIGYDRAELELEKRQFELLYKELEVLRKQWEHQAPTGQEIDQQQEKIRKFLELASRAEYRAQQNDLLYAQELYLRSQNIPQILLLGIGKIRYKEGVQYKEDGEVVLIDSPSEVEEIIRYWCEKLVITLPKQISRQEIEESQYRSSEPEQPSAPSRPVVVVQGGSHSVGASRVQTILRNLGGLFLRGNPEVTQQEIVKNIQELQKQVEKIQILQSAIDDLTREMREKRGDSSLAKQREILYQDERAVLKVIDTWIQQLQKTITLVDPSQLPKLVYTLSAATQAMNKRVTYHRSSELPALRATTAKWLARKGRANNLLNLVLNQLTKDPEVVRKNYSNIEFRYAVLRSAKQRPIDYRAQIEQYEKLPDTLENLKYLVGQLNEVLQDTDKWGTLEEDVIFILQQRIREMTFTIETSGSAEDREALSNLRIPTIEKDKVHIGKVLQIREKMAKKLKSYAQKLGDIEEIIEPWKVDIYLSEIDCYLVSQAIEEEMRALQPRQLKAIHSGYDALRQKFHALRESWSKGQQLENMPTRKEIETFLKLHADMQKRRELAQLNIELNFIGNRRIQKAEFDLLQEEPVLDKMPDSLFWNKVLSQGVEQAIQAEKSWSTEVD